MKGKVNNIPTQTSNIIRFKPLLFKIFALFVLVFSFSVGKSIAQNSLCNSSWLICTSQEVTYSGGLSQPDAESGPDYGCLSSQNNPAWFHMQIEVVGDIELNIFNPDNEDVDFICWGPFNDAYAPCTGQLTEDMEVDCSYSTTSNEYCNIPDDDMYVGAYYILMVANYSEDPCTIHIVKTDGTGETECSDIPAVASSNSPVCENNTLILNAIPNGASQYNWIGPNDFYSNEQNPEIPNATSALEGTYTLHMILDGNSSTPTSTDVTVSGSAVADFSFTPACLNESMQFTDESTSSTGITWAWDFGDGNTSTDQNPTHTYITTGDFDVILEVDNGACTDIITKTVTVTEIPESSFSYAFVNNTPCEDVIIQFTDLSTSADGIDSWAWDFGDGTPTTTVQNPTHSYSSGGSFIVTLTVSATTNCEGISQQTIVVQPAPAIDFSFTEDCEGIETHFIDSDFIDVASTTSWNYSFGDGQTSTESNPNYTYANSGSYPVVFTIIDINNCSNSIEHQVNVFEIPNAQFSYGTACQFSPTTFTDLSSPPADINNWLWDFGDGNTSNVQHPDHVFNNVTEDIFNVSLEVTSINACSNSTNQDVLVYLKPVANFSHQFTSGNACINSDIAFTNLSISNGGNIENILWDFGDGNTSNAVNPTHSYPTDGTFIVSLTVENTAGCDSTIQQEILINPNPVIDFSFSNACAGTSVDFIDSDFVNMATTTSWHYDFGDGSSSNQSDPNHIYILPGVYNVTFDIINNNGCTNHITHAVTVYENPIAEFTFDTVCQDSYTTFLDLSTSSSNINSWIWDFGDGNTSSSQNPQHLFNVSANETFNIALMVTTTENCSNIISKDVLVLGKPIANFSHEYISGNSCIGSEIAFTNLSSTVDGIIENSNWDFGDGASSVNENPTHTYLSAGIFTVSLAVTNTAGCDSIITQEVIVNPSPAIDFSFTEVCEGFTTHFNDSEFVNTSTTSTWLYDFGDGNTSDQSDPDHVYASANTYNVSLDIIDENGCVSNISHLVPVFANPIAQFTFDTVCQFSPTSFYDLSTPESTITNWDWNFDNLATSNEQNPQYLFNVIEDEAFNVELMVTTSESCTNTMSREVLVLGKPVADFTYAFSNGNQCIASEIEFDNLSTTASGVIETVFWDFGDSNTSTETNPIHSYANDGIYNITLTVINTGGCDSTIQQQLTIYPTPAIDFSFTEVCNGVVTNFYDDIHINMNATESWLYNFDNGNSSDQSNPSHLYAQNGVYNVAFSIIDTNGCANNISHPVEVFENAQAQFTFDTVCQFSETHFFDESTPQSAADNWLWDFDDSESSDIQNPVHVFEESGYYDVQLIVGNENNCQDTISKEVWVWQPPVANYIYSDSSCASGLVYFNDSSYSNESNVIDYLWRFPDNHVSFDPNTYFVFLNTNEYYNVSLEVNDARGCRDTILKEIFIRADLEVDFNADTVCFGSSTLLSAQIISPHDDTISQYSWFFNDGSPTLYSTEPNLSHEFTAAGVYEVKLLAENTNGCTSITRKNVKIRENPISDFSFVESYCHDSTVFTDMSIEAEGEIVYWRWEYGDGESLEVNHPNNPNHYHFYPSIYQNYQASLLAIDEFGCRDSSYNEVVHYPCILVNFQIDTSWICENTPAIFIDSTILDSDFVITDKSWYFGDGNSMQISPETDTVYYTYVDYGSFDVKLVVGYDDNDNHFIDSTQKHLEILPSPELSFTASLVCLGLNTEFSNQTTIDNNQLEQVYWNFGDGNDTSFIYYPGNTLYQHKYDSDGVYPVSLKIRAHNNCTDSITNLVTVHPLPQIGFLADSTIHCGNTTVTFTDTSHINSGIIAHRLWTFGDGDFATSSADTIQHIYDAGLYSVRLENTSEYYCKSQLLLEDYIAINPIFEADFEIEPNNLSINQISNLNVVNYVQGDSYFRWTLSDSIRWEDIYEPNIADSIHDTGIYELKMYTISEYGCIDSLSNFFEVTPALSIYVPTGFSPNGNGINDTFGPIGKYFDLKSYSFMIFNQWGEMVFSTTDFYEQWDGKTKNGEIAPIATYGWIIRLVDMQGNNKVMRGSITLLL